MAEQFLNVGTSAVVYPAAELVGFARRGGLAFIEVNLEATPVSDAVDIGRYGKAGEIVPTLLPQPRG